MTHAQTLKTEVCGIIDAMAAMLVDTSHDIHAHPELAFEEHHAAQTLAARVEQADVPVTRGAFGLETAFAAGFGPQEGPEVAILSEYDALPGIGHACGHNIIATCGLGAALALARLDDRLPGRIRYLGTPAEERGGGKEIMARQGAFDNLDAAMMVHPAGIDIATMPCLCVSEVKLVYHGKSAHASAMPQVGRNALDAMVSAYQSIAQLRQHIRADERIHGIITEGGDAPNIVPERTAGIFYVRAADSHALAALKARVQDCFDAGALATGCRAEVSWAQVDYLDLKTSWPLAEAYEANARTLGRTFLALDELPPGSSGSTDMGNVSHRVPSIHPMIAVAPPHVIIHNPEFTRWAASDRGDKAVTDGAKALAMTAIDFFCDASLRQAAADGFTGTAEQSAHAIDLAWHENGAPATGGCGCC